MNTTATTDIADDLYEILAGAGFAPLESDNVLVAEYALTARQAKVLGYFAERGWMAFRLEDDSAVDGWATLARDTDGQMLLMAINANGVTITEASFTLNTKGLAWLAAAVGA